MMDIFLWIEQALSPELCDSEAFIYEDMASQSGRSLPVIYTPFDPGQRAHWRDRGSLYDFLHAVHGEGQRLLDFGPGDGWPSLIVAPFAEEVVGVEGARRRVDVCTENAARLGVTNASFVFVPPGSALPFDDASFDGVMAASSVEQAPDPRATLAELFRVLRPGGRLRISYEALGAYRGGRERDLWLWGDEDGEGCRLIIFDRDLAQERVRQVGLTYALSKRALVETLTGAGEALTFDALTVERLEALSAALIDARLCITQHPSGATLAGWLREIGFRQIRPTHSGADVAGMLFDRLPPAGCPSDLPGVDARVQPVTQIACELAAPLDIDPMITAVK